MEKCTAGEMQVSVCLFHMYFPGFPALEGLKGLEHNLSFLHHSGISH